MLGTSSVFSSEVDGVALGCCCCWGKPGDVLGGVPVNVLKLERVETIYIVEPPQEVYAPYFGIKRNLMTMGQEHSALVKCYGPNTPFLLFDAIDPEIVHNKLRKSERPLLLTSVQETSHDLLNEILNCAVYPEGLRLQRSWAKNSNS